MALIESGLYDYLKGHAGLSALIIDRIYPLRLPDVATFPAVVYQKVTVQREVSHDGDTGLARSRFQFTCIDKTYIGAKNVADQIRLAFNGFSGAMGSVTPTDAFVVDETDGVKPDVNLFEVIVDVAIWHEEVTA